jgi:KaiC/GvpD/RAD55 family RecA-like ATPase
MFEYYDLSKLEHLPEQQWIIKNVVPNNGFVIVYGEPGSGKSFFALDLGLRISNNIMYHQNNETLKVVFVCIYSEKVFVVLKIE